MKTVQTHTLNLCGSSYDIGLAQGEFIKNFPPIKENYTSGFPGFTKDDLKKATQLFSSWCPGLNEELAGFADSLEVAPERILYYAMTYLRPNCSHIALMPGFTSNGHPLLARNYEFQSDAEDFILVKTSVSGKYTHIGTSVLNFGRDDGFNEHGLAVTMSSCGFPVGAMEYMRQPALAGLQFWAVIRALLEQCKNVEESLHYLKDMPIAYNLNLILLDKSGQAALVETLDGKMAVKRIDPSARENYLHATNHPHIDSLVPYEPKAMAHSLIRYQYIKDTLDTKESVTPEFMKSLLLGSYPEGLCCHYDKAFFGTTKSMLIDPMDGTIDLCWGGLEENGWHRYAMNDTFPTESRPVHIRQVDATDSMFVFKDL